MLNPDHLHKDTKEKEEMSFIRDLCNQPHDDFQLAEGHIYSCSGGGFTRKV